MTIHLFVYPTASVNLYDTLIAGDTLHIGTDSYYQSGVYTDTLTGLHGCDSVVNLYLYVAPPVTFAHLFDTICQGLSVSVAGHTYTVSGTYIDTLTGHLGGDSIVTLNLNVTQILFTNINDTIVHGASVTIGTNTYTQSGIYIDTLTGVAGCDSIVALHLIVGPLDISLINDQNPVRLYPNPNSGSFTLQSANCIGSNYTVCDILGDVITQQVIKSDSQIIDLPEAADGVYMLTVKGTRPIRFVIVK